MYTRCSVIGKLIGELTIDRHGQMNSRRQKIVEEANRNFGTLITGYYIFAVCAWFMIVVSPQTQEGITFPLGCWYPFDQTKPRWFELAYAHQAAGILFVGLVTQALDCVLIFLMQQLGMQLDLLKEEVLYLNEAVENATDGFSCQVETNEKIRHKLLVKAIDHHQDLIRFITFMIIICICIQVFILYIR